MRIGESAEEYQNRRGDEDEVWIKGFKDGMTTIRILPEPKTAKWTTYREHYDDGIGYFPCSEAKECVGCTDENKKVRDRSRRYAINALDGEGRVQVYKIGSRLYRTLQGREQRLGTLSDRDYIVIRTGTKLETNYDVDPGDKYELDWPEADELHDIPDILGAKYVSTAKLYSGDAEDQTEPPPEDEKPKPTANPRARKAAAPESEPEEEKPAARTNPRARKSAEAKPDPEPESNDPIDDEPSAEPEPEKPRRRMAGAAKKAEPEPEPEKPAPAEASQGDDVNGWGRNPSETVIEAADTATIKAWLDDYEVEYPTRAPRSRIIATAKELAAEPPF